MNFYCPPNAAIRAVPSPTSFKTSADYSDEMRRKLRQLASPECQQCKGEGIFALGTAEMKLCRCVPIH